MLKNTQFYHFPLWEIADVQPLLDTVNDGTTKLDKQLSNDLMNQLTAFKRLSNAITSFCHKRL